MNVPAWLAGSLVKTNGAIMAAKKIIPPSSKVSAKMAMVVVKIPQQLTFRALVICPP